MIRDARPGDAEAIVGIYNHYIRHSVATFEESVLTTSDMQARIRGCQQAGLPWYVLDEGGELVGYAYASPWKPRSAYRFSVEVTVYLAPDNTRRGGGTQLYAALFEALRARGIHAVLGGISLPNDASVALHEKFGMTKTGHLKEVGFKLNQWVDVGYWQGILNSDSSRH